MHASFVPSAWHAVLDQQSPVREAIERLVSVVAQRATIPERARLGAALAACPPEAVRVIVLGQDPYPTPGHACGLAFAMAPGGSEVPRSLRNIQAEVLRDGGQPGCDLHAWAAQGVLLLNRWLSLDADLRPDWDVLTGACVRAVWQNSAHPVAAMLWGRPAMTHGAWMSAPLPHRRLVLTASHPSPLSFRRPCGAAPAFSGCGHFGLVNQFLANHEVATIRW